jgi:hypothetical protein
MYSFGRRKAYNPFIGEFKKEEIDKGLYRFHDVVPCAILEIEVSKQQYGNAERLIDHFICNRDLYKYNYRGLLHSLINKEQCNDNRFLCSEFVYYILNESDIADFKIPRNLVRPQNLLALESKRIYKGNLKKLKYYNNYSENEINMRKLSTAYEKC